MQAYATGRDTKLIFKELNWNKQELMSSWYQVTLHLTNQIAPKCMFHVLPQWCKPFIPLICVVYYKDTCLLFIFPEGKGNMNNNNKYIYNNCAYQWCNYNIHELYNIWLLITMELHSSCT